MPARATPSSLNATPATTAFSVKVPFALLRYSLFGCVSFETKMSGHPSLSKSRTAIPSVFEVGSYNPACCVTSENFPSPSLCHKRIEAPLYDSGVQYDLLFPSIVQ